MLVLEIAGNVFNLLSVWFAARNSVHTWWCGLVGVSLYALMFFETRLYADVTLQLFFIASCIVGWWNWKRGASRTGAVGAEPTVELPITRVNAATGIVFIAAALASAAAYGWLLQRFTDAANPFVDSSVLALSILAQFLMVARKLETWPVWFVVDCIAAPLYASRGLWVTAAVYAFFLVLVVMGWMKWARLMRGAA